MGSKCLVVHFHIFKNAGSTVDHILERSFGASWRSFDLLDPAGRISSAQLAEFIERNPDAMAISSHQALLPPPVMPKIDIFPIVFLRHPIDRVRSIYEFERRQGLELGPVSRGSDYAARLSFKEYLRWRLDSATNGVVHNHQTIWLNFEKRLQRDHLTEADFCKAVSVLDGLPVVGVVERFGESISAISGLLRRKGHELVSDYDTINQSAERSTQLSDRLEKIHDILGAEMWHELLDRNKWDMRLYEYALNIDSGTRAIDAADPSA